MNRSADPILSVVVPVYGCADCLPALHERLAEALVQITERYEIVLVDDRSLDEAWSVIGELSRRDPQVRGYRLSRNFGQHAAITAGLRMARGQWAAVMDCDLQEAPEELPRLWAAAAEGHKVVRTIRRGRRHPPLRRLASRIYRTLTLETDLSPDFGTLSLLSRPVIEAFLSLQDRDREYMIALDWLGFDGTTVENDHAEREAGRSSYTPRQLLRVALDGMFFRSTVLLRLVVLAGFLTAAAGVGLAVVEVVEYFAQPSSRVSGYTSLAVLLLVLAGAILCSIGVVGLYVGRIFEQVKGRPLFVIDASTEPQPVTVRETESASAQPVNT